MQRVLAGAPLAPHFYFCFLPALPCDPMIYRFIKPLFLLPLLSASLLVGIYAPFSLAGAESYGVCLESCHGNSDCSPASPLRCCQDECQRGSDRGTLRPAAKPRKSPESSSVFVHFRQIDLRRLQSTPPPLPNRYPLFPPVILSSLRTIVLRN